MSPSEAERVLADPPDRHHFCQLHRDSEMLSRSVGLFAESGIRAGAAVVLVAAPGRLTDVIRHLSATGMDVDALCDSGQLLGLDAQSLLDEFMNGHAPDWRRFHATVGGVLDAVKGRGLGRVRVYGEMVNILWNAGKPAAAIRLEEFWNELATEYEFSLFCGYELDGFDPETYSRSLAHVGTCHGEVLREPDNARFVRAIEAASHEVFGVSLVDTFDSSEPDCPYPGERNLPSGYRTLLWLQRNMPATLVRVLHRARHHYQRVAADA